MFVVAHLFAATVTFALAVYVVVRGGTDRSLRVFGVLLVSIVVFSAAEAARLLTPGLGGKYIWQVVGYLGIVAIPPAFLLFVLSYTGRGQYISAPTVAVLGVEPVLTLALLGTNGSHQLFYSAVELLFVGETPLMQTTAGPGYWLHTGYTYLVVGLAIALLVGFAITSDRLYRLQVVALVSGSLVPVIANLAFLVGLSPNSALDFTPPTFALSALFIFVGVSYGRFTHLLPVDRGTILSTVRDGMVVTDQENRVVYTNAAAESILGVPGSDSDRDQVVGEPLSDVLPLVTSEAAATVTNADGTRGIEASLWRDGQLRWFWIREADPDPRGPESTVVILTEITERKARQRRSDRIQRTAWQLMDVDDVERIGDVAVQTAREVFSLPLSGVYLADDATDSLAAVSTADPLRERVGPSPAFPRDSDDPLARLAWEVYETEDPVDVPDTREAEWDPFGATRRRSLVVVPLPGHGVFVLSADEPQAFDRTDLTLVGVLASTVTGALEQAKSKRELRANERRLARQNERLEEFTGVVSHDLRSPLNAATGYLDLLNREYDDDLIDKADDALDRMDALVGDLLTLARQGRTVDETTVTPLTETVRRAWETVPAAETALAVDRDIGAASVDESRLRQAFENLFRNAVDHAGTGSQIRVGPLESGDGFYVEDDGQGIPPDNRARVFEHGYSTSEDGTGLGLAIVKRICEAHGWELRVVDGRDGGARFEVTGVDLDPVEEPTA